MFGKHHTWVVNRGSGSEELYTIQQDDVGSVAGANIYLPGKAKFGVSTADYIIRVQDHGKDFQVTTKSGQLLAEARSFQDCSHHIINSLLDPCHCSLDSSMHTTCCIQDQKCISR